MVCAPCTSDPRVLLGPGVQGGMSREFSVVDRPVVLRAYGFRRVAGDIVTDEDGVERRLLPSIDCARLLQTTEFCGEVYVAPVMCGSCETTLSYCDTTVIVALPGKYRVELMSGEIDDLLVTIDELIPGTQVTVSASQCCGCK